MTCAYNHVQISYWGTLSDCPVCKEQQREQELSKQIRNLEDRLAQVCNRLSRYEYPDYDTNTIPGGQNGSTNGAQDGD